MASRTYKLGERISLPDGTTGSVIDDDMDTMQIHVISYINGEKVIRTFPYEVFGLPGKVSMSHQANQEELARIDISRLQQEQKVSFGKSHAEVARIIRPFQEILERRQDLRNTEAYRTAQRILSIIIRNRCSNDYGIETAAREFENLRTLGQFGAGNSKGISFTNPVNNEKRRQSLKPLVKEKEVPVKEKEPDKPLKRSLDF